VVDSPPGRVDSRSRRVEDHRLALLLRLLLLLLLFLCTVVDETIDVRKWTRDNIYRGRAGFRSFARGRRGRRLANTALNVER
jgi:hypothetical protein